MIQAVGHVVLAQMAPSRMRGIQEHFSEGGAALTWDFLKIMGVVLAGAGTAYLIYATIQRRRRRELNNAKALFTEVVRQLPLSIPQRELLRRMAAGLHLSQPVVLLLSPRMFNTYANRWMSISRNANRSMRKRINSIAESVFPISLPPHRQ